MGPALRRRIIRRPRRGRLARLLLRRKRIGFSPIRDRH